VTYRIPSHVYHRALHDEVVLLDPRTDAYLGLNPTAAVAWDVLASGGTPEDAAAALIEQFAVDAETAHADIAALIGDLLARGLLEPAGAETEGGLGSRHGPLASG